MSKIIIVIIIIHLWIIQKQLAISTWDKLSTLH